MKVLAFDISSNNTGWSYVELESTKKKTNIINFEYGNISSTSSMDTYQRLYFFGNEMNKLIAKYEPDEIGVEEAIVVYGHGFKTARTLARFSGVAFWFAYNYQKKPVFVYEPTHWRKMLGLSGKCHKTEVQLFVVKTLGLLDDTAIKKYRELIKEEALKIDQYKIDRTDKEKEMTLEMRESLKDLKAQLKKAKKEKSSEVESLEKDIKRIEKDSKKEIKDMKAVSQKAEKKAKNNYGKALDKIGIDIYSDTGIDNNISDSFGINLGVFSDLGIKL